MTTDNMHISLCEWMPWEEWKYFGTATFKDKVTRSESDERFSRMVLEAKKVLGAGFRCVYVTKGGNGSKPHVRFLIGGIPYSPAVCRQLQQLWNRIGGDDAQCEAGLHYTLKAGRSGESGHVNFVLPNKAEAPQPAKLANGSGTASAPKAAAATVKPKGPAWRQRISAVLARWEGKLS